MNNTNRHEILVVDDTPESLQLLTRILTEAGYKVRSASDGPMAIQSAELKVPDLIILDVRMPEMDGYEVCRRLKKESRFSPVPVLFLSAAHETVDKVRGFEAGGVDFLTKPFDTNEILVRVKTHLTLSIQAKALRESEARSRNIINTDLDGFAIIDMRYSLIEVNESYCSMLGYSEEELLTKKVSDIEAQLTAEEVEQTIQKLVQTSLGRFETMHRKKDGSIIPVEVTARFDEGFIYAFVHDLTRRKAEIAVIEQERARFSAVFASAPVGLILINADTVVTRANPYAGTLVLRDAGDLIGERAGGALQCVHSTENSRGCGFGESCSHCPLRQALEGVLKTGGRVHNAEVQVELNLNGAPTKRWLLVNVEPLTYDNAPHCIVAIDDITDRKQLAMKVEDQAEMLAESQRIGRIGSYTFDFFNDIWSCTDIMDEIFGISKESAHTFAQWIDIIHPEGREEALNYYNSLLCNNLPHFEISYRIVRPSDGAVRWIKGIGQIRYIDGKPVEMVGTIQDVTEQMIAKHERVRISELLASTSKLSKIGGWYLNIKTEEVVWTEEVYRIHEVPLSYKPNLTEGIRFYHPDSVPVISQAVQDCISFGTPYDLELRLITATGTERHVRSIGETVSESGKVIGLKGVFMDITEQIQLRKEREASEEKYRVFFEASPIPLWAEDFSSLSEMFESLREQGVADLETYLVQHPERVAEFASKVKIITVNQACLDFYKVDSLDSFLGNIATTFTEDSLTAFRQQLVHLYTGENSFEVACRVKTLLGEERFVNINFFLRESLDLSRVLVATIDRTEEEELLHKHIDREQFYKGILDSLNDEIVVIRPDHSISLTNRTFTNHLSPEELQKVDEGTFCYSICSALGESDCDTSCTRHIGLSHPKNLTVTRVTEQKGVQVLDKIISPLYSVDGVKTGLVISLRDITERENERTKMATLAEVVEQVPASIVITDLSGIIEYVNPAFTVVSGYTFEEAIGQNPRILNSGVQAPEVYKEMWESIVSGGSWKGTFVNKRKDGSFYTEESLIAPIVDDHGHIIKFIAVKTDITEQLNLAEQLHRSQKMESLGRLAGGVAHDFNNILTAISGYAEFMKYDLPVDSTYHEDAEGILEAVNMASSLTRQLLLFSRNQVSKPQVVVVGEVVDNLSKLLRRLVTEAITFTISITDKSTAIFIDPGQLEQLFMNLIVNAVDAISMYPEAESRKITLSIDRAGTVTAPRLVIKVSDTGCGMSADVKEKIFDPFFTTKEVGKGTGLGLSTVFAVVEQYHGTIVVESSPGKGATFIVSYPAINASTENKATDQVYPTGGSGVVLLVDDEENIRSVTTRMLKRFGYEVYSCSLPEKMIEIVNGLETPPSILVTDVVMPKMSGIELASKVHERYPDLPVLYVSGYLDQQMPASYYDVITGDNFMQKPFGAQELQSKIVTLLAKGEKNA